MRPKETTQKLLISTTSRFVGEYTHDDLLITHAWPDTRTPHQISATENPYCRNYFVIVATTDEIEKKPGIAIPDYSYFGEVICIYLSILFGKRFDNNGSLENCGQFRVPFISETNYPCKPTLPQNNHSPRPDISIPLNLSEIYRIETLLFDSSVDPKFKHFLVTSGKFYMQALRNFEENPEIAYLNLITCGEILSNFFQYDKDSLLDEEAKKIITTIETELGNGRKIANQIKSRLFQVKRRFTDSITNLLTEEFFSNSECKREFAALNQKDIRKRVSAAYDLRSRYVHTGISFGGWVSSMAVENNEIQVGMPVVEDKEFKKILSRAPTYVGLERIIRFCLLKFMNINGIKIDSKLTSKQPNESII